MVLVGAWFGEVRGSRIVVSGVIEESELTVLTKGRGLFCEFEGEQSGEQVIRNGRTDDMHPGQHRGVLGGPGSV